MFNRMIDLATRTYHHMRINSSTLHVINAFLANMGKFFKDTEYQVLRENCIQSQQVRAAASSTRVVPGITINEGDYIQCAVNLKLKYPDKKIAIHNMANAITPGAAVIRARGSAEELMCRVSDLYPQLFMQHVEDYQHHPLFHFVMSHLQPITDRDISNYTDLAIQAEQYAKQLNDNKKYSIPELSAHYTKNVIFLINHNEQVTTDNTVVLDVISSAAYDLRLFSFFESDKWKFTYFGCMDIEKFKTATKNKIRILFDNAIQNKIDMLVLSAFGCGAFANDPDVVSRCFKEVLEEERYKTYAETACIVFSIYHDQRSLDAFSVSNITSRQC